MAVLMLSGSGFARKSANDKQQVEPSLEELATREDEPGKPEAILADRGYFSESNVSAVGNYGATAYIAEKCDAHNKPLMEYFKPDDPMPEGNVLKKFSD